MTTVDYYHACDNSNKLNLSLRRHIHRIGRHIVKIPLQTTEQDYYGHCHDSRLTRLNNENAIAATELVQQFTSIPVPKLVANVQGEQSYTVCEYLGGIDMETAWEKMSSSQIENVKHQLRG